MKKNRAYTAKIFAVLSAAVLLTGCTGTDTAHTSMSELCVFRQRSDGTPIRTMLTNGTTSTVCVDPLCLHDDSCPLAGISNLTDGSIHVLETYHDNVLLLYGYDRYLYYTTAVYSRTDAGEQYGYVLYRADINSGKIIEIPTERAYSSLGNAMNTGDIPSIYAIDDDRIYWYAPGEDGYIHYTTDLAGKNRKELPLANPRIMNGVYYDGWAYYTMNRNEGSIADCQTDLERQKFLNEKTLRRYHLETEKDEMVADNLARFIVTEAGIFYTVYENEPKEIEFNNDTYYDIFAGELYRMNHDGSSSAAFCTLEDVNLSVWSDVFLGYAEGRLAVAYMDAVENDWFESGYDYNIAPEIIIVDTTDGTWRISEDET